MKHLTDYASYTSLLHDVLLLGHTYGYFAEQHPVLLVSKSDATRLSRELLCTQTEAPTMDPVAIIDSKGQMGVVLRKRTKDGQRLVMEVVASAPSHRVDESLVKKGMPGDVPADEGLSELAALTDKYVVRQQELFEGRGTVTRGE